MATIKFAKVTSTKDDNGLGMVLVKFHRMTPEVELPIPLRVMQIGASAKGAGCLFLPEIGDEVVILAPEEGSYQDMVVLGSVYNGTNKPKTPDKDDKNNIKQIVTRGGSELTIDDTSGSEKITLQTKEGKLSLVMDQKAKTITVTGETEIKLSSPNGKVTVEAAEITITGKSKAITLDGKADVTVQASGTLTLKGNSVKIG